MSKRHSTSSLTRSHEPESPGGTGRRNFLSRILKRNSSGPTPSGPINGHSRENSKIPTSEVMSDESSATTKSHKAELDTKRLSRNFSVRSGKSQDHQYIDRDDATIFNSEEEGRLHQNGNSDSSPESETSSVYSSLQRTGSMSIIDHTESSIDNSNVNIIDQKLNDILNRPVYQNSTPWEAFRREALTNPKYLRITRRNKNSPHVLKRLFLAQELNNTEEDSLDSEISSQSDMDDEKLSNKTSRGEFSHKKANHVIGDNMGKEIFIMEFSRDGKYLAVAGRGSVIKIFKVISSPLGRLEYDNYQEAHVQSNKKNKADEVYAHAPVFHQSPVRIFRGHRNSVLSLDWSKNNFLISGSMDKTVKLWHVDRPDYLSSFQHDDFVTTVKFHPTDDRFFFSGSLDNNARIWSVLERTVAFGRHLGDDMLITSSSFTPDGVNCLVGGFNGTLIMLETKGLHIVNRFEIKPRHLVPLTNHSGNKITNIKVFSSAVDDIAHVDYASRWTYLITTNDSKIRLVNIKKKKLMTRFKGSTNTSSIEASMSDDGQLIMCGSEDHWCYIWDNNNSIINNKLKVAVQDMLIEGKNHINDLQHKHKHYHDFITHNKLFKKLNVQQLLKDESTEFISNENSSYASFHAHHSSVNAAVFAPNTTKKLLELSDDLVFDLLKRGRLCQQLDEYSKFKIVDEESIETGNEGFIIVTTDETGLIRVFRQDPAYEIRKTILELYKKEGGDKKSEKDCKGRSRLHSKSLSPIQSHSNFKNKLQSKIKTNDTVASDSPNSTISVSSSAAKSTPPKLQKNISFSSAPATSLGTPKSQRPYLKSLSNGILDSNHAAVQVRPNTLSITQNDPSLKPLNEQGQEPLGLITPEKEISTPFPMLKSKSTQNSIPLIVNTDDNTRGDPEIVNFTTPINAHPSMPVGGDDLYSKRSNA